MSKSQNSRAHRKMTWHFYGATEGNRNPRMGYKPAAQKRGHDVFSGIGEGERPRERMMTEPPFATRLDRSLSHRQPSRCPILHAARLQKTGAVALPFSLVLGFVIGFPSPEQDAPGTFEAMACMTRTGLNPSLLGPQGSVPARHASLPAHRRLQNSRSRSGIESFSVLVAVLVHRNGQATGVCKRYRHGCPVTL